MLQGISYLVDNGLLEWEAESVAEFLYKEEGLNKSAIGNFLGDRCVGRTWGGAGFKETLKRKSTHTHTQ